MVPTGLNAPTAVKDRWLMLCLALLASTLLPVPVAAQSGCYYGGSSGIPRGCAVGAPPASVRPAPVERFRNPDNSDAEEAQKTAQYNQLRNQASVAFDAKNYALALQLYEQALSLRDGPATRANIALVKAMMAWYSDPRAALAYLQGRRQYLDQYDAPESASLKATNDEAIARLQGYLAANAQAPAKPAANEQAVRDQAKIVEDARRAAAEIAKVRSDAERAAALVTERNAQDIAAADRKTKAFVSGDEVGDSNFPEEKAAAGGLKDADGGAGASGQRPSEHTVMRDGRSYQPSGNGMVGGTVWITGYNVQKADPAVVKKAHEMMAEQMRLAGMAYADGVDFQRYNFVLGIAASTNTLVDLASRVVFDEYKNGRFSAENQAAYNGLKGRQFGELGCHSNGAMVCLAALENHDIVADKVVLYGPQITVESLKMWDELVREHKVGSIQIYVNSGDPVPPVSLAIGGGTVGSYLVSSLALMRPASFVDVIHETAPELKVRTLSCASSPDLNCHGADVYNRNVRQIGCGARSSTSPATAVPGTALPGRPETAAKEPPPPC
jgi:hypothetical protein